MELELALALPINPIKVFHPKEMETTVGYNGKYIKEGESKRSFEEAFGKIEEAASRKTRTLPLLVWDGRQPNEEDDQKEHHKRDSCTINRIDMDEEDHVVGWPPINSSRRKLLHGGRMARKQNVRSNSIYVKVKMEGVAIARKIDLRLFHSYQTLKSALLTMFAKYQKCKASDESYTITYQDKEGDWLLAGDVPWQSFIESVQRLKIVRSGS
ncbi:hypothetical protein UlMin_035997 [Ulmus minor]